MINNVLLAYAALLGLAAALRMRYRTWFALLLATLVALGLGWAYVRDARVVARAPAYTQDLIAGLRARPWPVQPAELAQLIASLRALNDLRDANALQPLYRLQVAHGLAGEPVEQFSSVSEALAWTPPPKPGARSTPWSEEMRTERRALTGMLEAQAPRLSGWPPDLARDLPLKADASEIAPGVWLSPAPENHRVGTLQFPVSVHHRGAGAIAAAQINVVVQDPSAADAPGGRRPIFSCHAALRDLAPGETRVFGCALPVSLGTDRRPLQRVLDNIEAFRAGTLDVHILGGGTLDADLLKVPQADTLIAPELQHLEQLKESDKQALARRNAVEPYLALWLGFGTLFAAGMVFPGLRRGCLSVPATLALAAAGFAAALLGGWVLGTHTSGIAGWEPIVAIFSAFEFGMPFIGGLLFGNLLYLRQRVAQK